MKLNTKKAEELIELVERCVKAEKEAYNITKGRIKYKNALKKRDEAWNKLRKIIYLGCEDYGDEFCLSFHGLIHVLEAITDEEDRK